MALILVYVWSFGAFVKKYQQLCLFLDRWSDYKEKIGKAVRDYKQCDPADCFKLQRRSDFRFWVDNGGIKESDVLHAKDRQLGEHYQIIDKKLYRTKSCIFPSRSEWFVKEKKLFGVMT